MEPRQSGKTFLAESSKLKAPRRRPPITEGTARGPRPGQCEGRGSERRLRLGLGHTESSSLPQAGTCFLLANVC